MHVRRRRQDRTIASTKTSAELVATLHGGESTGPDEGWIRRRSILSSLGPEQVLRGSVGRRRVGDEVGKWVKTLGGEPRVVSDVAVVVKGTSRPPWPGIVADELRHESESLPLCLSLSPSLRKRRFRGAVSRPPRFLVFLTNRLSSRINFPSRCHTVRQATRGKICRHAQIRD